MVAPVGGGVSGVVLATHAPAAEPGFGEQLEAAVDAVDKRQHNADASLSALASGTEMDLHGTMIALEEANIALRAMSSARDKVIEAYQAIWNMQV